MTMRWLRTSWARSSAGVEWHCCICFSCPRLLYSCSWGIVKGVQNGLRWPEAEPWVWTPQPLRNLISASDLPGLLSAARTTPAPNKCQIILPLSRLWPSKSSAFAIIWPSAVEFVTSVRGWGVALLQALSGSKDRLVSRKLHQDLTNRVLRSYSVTHSL